MARKKRKRRLKRKPNYMCQKDLEELFLREYDQKFFGPRVALDKDFFDNAREIIKTSNDYSSKEMARRGINHAIVRLLQKMLAGEIVIA